MQRDHFSEEQILYNVFFRENSKTRWDKALNDVMGDEKLYKKITVSSLEDILGETFS